MPEDTQAIPSAKLFLRDASNEILILQRSANSKRFKHIWDMPGGKVDPGESLEDALHRELHEETGLVCSALTKLGERTFNIETMLCIETLYTAELVGDDKVRLSDEHEEYRWVALELLESENLPMLPGMTEFARNCKELHND